MDTFATVKLMDRLNRLSNEHFLGDIVVFLKNGGRIFYENVAIGPVVDTRWLHIYDDKGREEMVLVDEIVRLSLINKNDGEFCEKSSENTKTCSCSEEISEGIEAFKRDFFENLKKHFGVERGGGDD